MSVLPANDEESRLLALLSHEPLHIDKLSRQSSLAPLTVASTVMMLELKGAVRQVGSLSFVLAHCHERFLISLSYWSQLSFPYWRRAGVANSVGACAEQGAA